MLTDLLVRTNNKNMKKLQLLILTLMFASVSLAQTETPFDKKLFKEQKDQFKVALKHYEEGDAYYMAYSVDYRKAVSEYLQAYDFNPNSSELNYKIGMCYYNFDKYKMKKYFETAYKLKPTVAPDVLYYLGISYHIEGQWQKAVDYYNQFASVANAPEMQKLKTEAFKKVQECKNGQDLADKKARVWIDNLGKMINTKYPGYGPVISADEAIMVFTARRPDAEDLSPDGAYFEDMFVSERVNREWQQSKNICKPLTVSVQFSRNRAR